MQMSPHNMSCGGDNAILDNLSDFFLGHTLCGKDACLCLPGDTVFSSTWINCVMLMMMVAAAEEQGLMGTQIEWCVCIQVYIGKLNTHARKIINKLVSILMRTLTGNIFFCFFCVHTRCSFAILIHMCRMAVETEQSFKKEEKFCDCRDLGALKAMTMEQRRGLSLSFAWVSEVSRRILTTAVNWREVVVFLHSVAGFYPILIWNKIKNIYAKMRIK